jgi:hypothetical protein
LGLTPPAKYGANSPSASSASTSGSPSNGTKVGSSSRVLSIVFGVCLAACSSPSSAASLIRFWRSSFWRAFFLLQVRSHHFAPLEMCDHGLRKCPLACLPRFAVLTGFLHRRDASACFFAPMVAAFCFSLLAVLHFCGTCAIVRDV